MKTRTSIADESAGTPTHAADGAAFGQNFSSSDFDARDTDHREFADRGVTFRAVILSLLLAAFFGYIVPIIDLLWSNTYLGGGHLPVGAMGALLVLLALNVPLRVLAKRVAFSRNEMLVVFITCLFSCLIPGMGSEGLFVSHIIGPFYFATQENGWSQLLSQHLPSWFSPALSMSGHYDEAAQRVVNDWFVGNKGVVPWAAWTLPLLAWGSFIFASYLMLGCFSVMLRAQWGEREALAFPLMRVPVAMTESDDNKPALTSKFFRNPTMWIGFGLAVLYETLGGLNVYFPDVPRIPNGLTLNLFTEAPLNQMAPMAFLVFPIFAAITFLLTAEVSFSLWFFLFLVNFQYIVAYALGFPNGTLPAAIGNSSDGVARTFTAFQQVGAYIAYVGILMWTARAHFAHIIRRAFGRVASTRAERNEALSYPAAFWGFVLSFLYLIVWSTMAGIRPDVALAMWTLYLITAIGLTRAVVEGGVMFINQGWVPLGTLAQLTGSGATGWLGANSIVPASFMQVSFFTDMRAFIMPSFLQGFKLAHDRKIAARPLWFLVCSCALVALGVSVYMKVKMGYESGGLGTHLWFSTVAPKYPPQNSKELIAGAHDVGAGNWLWLGIGMVFTYGLMLARSRFLWFPLHPLGYLLALTAPTQRVWLSFFVGWLAKVTITRFGGTDAYRKMIPVALGIVVGEVSMMLFWLIVDGINGRVGHGLLP